MNGLQHVNVKIFAKPGATVRWHDLTPVFHRWIQTQALPELLIDVADYAHVPAGPGMMLIAHEAFYSVDNRANRLGLLYNRRTAFDGTAEEKIRQAWDAALTAARKLSEEVKLEFDENDVEVFVNDRAVAPNNEESLEALAPALRAVFGEGAALDQDTSDPRGLFRVRVKRAE